MAQVTVRSRLWLIILTFMSITSAGFALPVLIATTTGRSYELSDPSFVARNAVAAIGYGLIAAGLVSYFAVPRVPEVALGLVDYARRAPIRAAVHSGRQVELAEDEKWVARSYAEWFVAQTPREILVACLILGAFCAFAVDRFLDGPTQSLVVTWLLVVASLAPLAVALPFRMRRLARAKRYLRTERVQ